MTVIPHPFDLVAVPKPARMKPREAIDVWALDARHIHELAVLRAHHPGGAPNIDPRAWSGAFENGRLVAALGWTMFEEGIVTIQEIDRADDRWGTIGSSVLIRSFVMNAYDKGLRIQAWVMPDNTKLKEFIHHNVPSAKIILEIWE